MTTTTKVLKQDAAMRKRSSSLTEAPKTLPLSIKLTPPKPVDLNSISQKIDNLTTSLTNLSAKMDSLQQLVAKMDNYLEPDHYISTKEDSSVSTSSLSEKEDGRKKQTVIIMADTKIFSGKKGSEILVKDGYY